MLTTVTITGADDKTSHADMVSLAKEFPFVEWGILVSPKKSGTPRYPGADWIDELPDLRLSLHLCGQAARSILDGVIPSPFSHGIEFYRYQLNGYTPPASDEFIAMTRATPHRWILQARSDATLSEAIADALRIGNEKAAILYDPSGGRGIEAASWPKIPAGVYFGFAGGIKPSNVVAVLADIGPADAPFWIDMESGVRTDDQLDLNLVRQVLKSCAPYVEKGK